MIHEGGEGGVTILPVLNQGEMGSRKRREGKGKKKPEETLGVEGGGDTETT